MAERRSLGDALSLTPEKVHFIKNDKNDAFDESRQSASEPPAREPEQRMPRADNRLESRTKSAPTYAPSLVSVTTRLQQDTAAALRRAYLEQKLNRQFPDTQQEIIEEALQHWLYEKGFLS